MESVGTTTHSADADDRFDWSTFPRWDGLDEQRLVFVDGSAAEAVASEWRRLGRPRTLGVGTREDRIAAVLTGVPDAALWGRAAMHVPREIAEQAVEAARAERAELIVAVGGGSAVGFAKWISHRLGTPSLVVPSTLAGSEATASFGVTDGSGKKVETSAVTLPRTIVYDSTYVAALPARVLVESAYNALAHSIDSLWTPRTDAELRRAALSATGQLGEAMLAAAKPPLSPTQRGALQRAAYRSAAVFAAAGSGLHHKLCHVLGGTFALDHAGAHAAVLPYSAGLLSSRDPDSGARLADALGAASVADGFDALHAAWGRPRSLDQLGLAETDIPRAAALTYAALPPSLAELCTPGDVERVVREAWRGDLAPSVTREEVL